MVGRTRIRRDSEKDKTYKGQEIEKSHDYPHREAMWHIEERKE